MKEFKKDIIIYLGTFLVSITIGLFLSHRSFSPNLDYRIRANDASIIYYTSFLFILPLLIKLALNRIEPNVKFSKPFKIQFWIAVITTIVPIIIMLDESSVKSGVKNYFFDYESDLYLFYSYCKLCSFTLILILVILLLYQFIRKINKKYSL